MFTPTRLLTFAPLLLLFARTCDPPPPPPEVWIFCGVDAEASNAETAAAALAASGATSTLGRCKLPAGSYTPAHTSDRYTSRHGYGLLIGLNARHGMSTVVYDPGIWSDDPAERAAAIDYYRPVLSSIRAWDLGDEYDPASPAEWGTLVHRWQVILDHVTPVTGVRPFSSHLPERYGSLDAAARDLPGALDLLAVNEYDVPLAVDTARRWAPRARMMCAVNGYAMAGLSTTTAKIEADTRALRDAGCSAILVFGGEPVAGAPDFAPVPGWGSAIFAGTR
jgi:hypothetical protein